MASNDEDSSPTGRSKWLHSIESYLKVTEETSFSMGSNLGLEEVKSALQLLPNSAIKELIVDGNNLNGKVEDLLEFLPQTEITVLSLKGCHLLVDDFLNLINIMKDTQITDFNVSWNQIELDQYATNELITYVRESQLTAVNLEFNDFPSYDGSHVLLAGALTTTSITHLNLSNFFSGHDCYFAIVSLFSNLKHSVIKILNLSGSQMESVALKDIGESFRDSKLEELDLSHNKIDDEGINYLFEALERSMVVNLSLKGNQIHGSNSLGHRIKDTKVRILDLSLNTICEIEMFAFPNFLRGSSVESLNLYGCLLNNETGQQIIECLQFSKVTTLNLACNCLQLSTFLKFVEISEYTDIVSIDISGNNLQYDAIIALGDCLKASKLNCIKLAGIQNYDRDAIALGLAAFLGKTKGSSLVSLDLSCDRLQGEACKNIAQILTNTTLTHINLSSNNLKEGVINLATCLQFTCITHLNLNSSDIGDAGAEALAKCLKETQIVELDIGENDITSCGAKALAYSLKDSKVLRLILSENKIENDGLEVLIIQVRHSFITVLDVKQNPGNRFMLIDTVLWENRALAQRLIVTFKRITLESDDNNLYFDQNIDGIDIGGYLEDCLFLYARVIQQPSALNVLLEEDKISFSRDQISRLMVEKFPQQFSDFIGRSVSAEVIEHVIFLKKVENLGLSKVVECLLLNRPLYTIDGDQGVLHPYVYPLLLKYKQPICNTAVEPQAKNKLIQYFSENSNLEGAADVVGVLRNLKI